MKRGIRVLAVLVALLLFCLSGCRQEAGYDSLLNPKEPVSIEIWNYYNGPQKIAFDNLVSEFNETVGLEKGIVVQVFNQGNVNDLTEKVLESAAKKVGADEIPDIFAAYADTAYQVDKLGLVAELDQYLTKEELAEFVPGYLEEGRFDEKQSLKIFPVAKSSELMMLNKTDWDRFQEATGADVGELSTMEGIARVAKQYYEWTDSLTPEPDDGKAFFGRDAMANYMIIGCKQLGVEIFKAENGEVTLNLDQAVLRRLWDNFYVPYVNGCYGAYGKFRSDDAKVGDIIALVGSTSGAAYFPDQVITDESTYPIEVLALPAPIFEGGEKVAVQQGAGMVVTKSTPVQEYASTVFLKWFTQQERNIGFSLSSSYMPVKTAANDMDTIRKVIDSDDSITLAANLDQALPVAIGMVKTHTMYTSKAFEHGTQARNVLENSMIDQANKDLEAINALMAAGKTKAEAVSRYTADENFDHWFDSFQKELQEVIK